jgi:arylsulfatase
LLYLATGACHSPHQAPASWIERYRGQFDDGWDLWREATLQQQIDDGILPSHTELSPRPEWVPAWDSLSDATRAVYARYMEAFAGFLSHTDAQIGRVVSWLDETEQLDNTLLLVLSDNGASSEGGPTGSLNDVRVWNALPRTVAEAYERLDEIGGPRVHNNYPWGWTVAGNTPFRRWKRETHEGGVADPLIVHWPAGIALDERGTLRHQYVHAIDLVPTVLEALGAEAPVELDGVEQRPLEGVSFAYTFDEPDAPERHTTQYYEMFGCRALYHEGWKAVTYHEIQADEPGLDEAPWELYDLRADPSECHDRAADEPDRLRTMIDRWWEEAERYQVLPLDNRPFSAAVLDRPRYVGERRLFEYWPYRARVPEEQAPDVRNRPHQVTALLAVGPEEPPPHGVLVAQGSVLGGWSFHLRDDGVLTYVHNLSGLTQERVDAAVELAPGLHALAFRYTPGVAGEPAIGALRVDGEVVGEGPIRAFTWSRFSLTGAGLTVGYATAFPPSDDYVAPFRFSGTLERAFIEVDEPGEPVDPFAAAAALADDAIAME